MLPIACKSNFSFNHALLRFSYTFSNERCTFHGYQLSCFQACFPTPLKNVTSGVILPTLSHGSCLRCMIQYDPTVSGFLINFPSREEQNSSVEKRSRTESKIENNNANMFSSRSTSSLIKYALQIRECPMRLYCLQPRLLR